MLKNLVRQAPMNLSPQVIALGSAISYAAANIAARFGMKHSNPVTMTLISFTTQTVVFWSLVLLSGSVPEISYFPAVLFVGIGFVMPVIRTLTYIGIVTMGASRSVSLRSSYPLFGALFALIFLNEELKPLVLAGTLLVVSGTFFITWQRANDPSAGRWWHALFPLTAALISGLIQPVVRYGLTVSYYPLFSTALVGVTSLSVYLGFLPLIKKFQRPIWSRKGLKSLVIAALLENLGFLLFITAFGLAPVAAVSPLIATSPMWVVLAALLIFRDLEQVSLRTMIGTALTVAGTIVITLRG
ncbi:MAG: DMT family transporter [Deltaproteobacteria bacterium]|nr:DMT family transporter [Deltaproteobacteria bacterium]